MLRVRCSNRKRTSLSRVDAAPAARKQARTREQPIVSTPDITTDLSSDQKGGNQVATSSSRSSTGIFTSHGTQLHVSHDEQSNVSHACHSIVQYVQTPQTIEKANDLSNHVTSTVKKYCFWCVHRLYYMTC